MHVTIRSAFGHLQHVDKIFVTCISNKIILAGRVDRQDLGPNGHEEGPQFSSGRLEKFENVGKDSDGEGKVNGPGSEVEEPSQKIQGSQSMGLA